MQFICENKSGARRRHEGSKEDSMREAEGRRPQPWGDEWVDYGAEGTFQGEI